MPSKEVLARLCSDEDRKWKTVSNEGKWFVGGDELRELTRMRARVEARARRSAERASRIR